MGPLPLSVNNLNTRLRKVECADSNLILPFTHSNCTDREEIPGGLGCLLVEFTVRLAQLESRVLTMKEGAQASLPHATHLWGTLKV